MPEQQPAAPNKGEGSSNKDDDLVKRVAERVWELWREELRRERERRGRPGRQ